MTFANAQEPILGTEIVGKASYYGKNFYGHKTASGEILKKGDLTCAHPSLPFGTMLEVTNLSNNKWCIVRVNDRGPFTKKRILDLSYKAAFRLGMFQSGIAKVKMVIVGDNNNIIISRPETIIENSIELVSKEDKQNELIFPKLNTINNQEKVTQNKKATKTKIHKSKKSQ